jgi:hypothetical protein
MTSAIDSWDAAMDRVWDQKMIGELAVQALEEIKNSHKAFSHSIAERTLKAIEDVKNQK